MYVCMYVYVCVPHIMYGTSVHAHAHTIPGALLDFDGAEPGTTNEESENLRR